MQAALLLPKGLLRNNVIHQGVFEYSSKQVALAIVPKCSAFLSILGSGYILQYIVRRPKKRRTVFSRIMVGMSFSDIVASICFFLSTWPVPAGTVGAIGTTQTCTAHGFFGQAAYLCTPLYNGVLALYYLLVIRYQWKEEQLKRVELFLHAVPLTLALGIAVTGLVLDLYNFANFICWIAPLPWGCLDTARYGSENANCIRGDNGTLRYYPCSDCILVSVISCVISFVLLFMYTHCHHLYRNVTSLDISMGISLWTCLVSDYLYGNKYVASLQDGTRAREEGQSMVIQWPTLS